MITDQGRDHILRYLAGYVGSIASVLAVGVGESPASVGDVRLAHEVLRVGVDSVGVDFDARMLVFKGTLPAEFAGEIYEVGAFSAPQTQLGAGGSRTLLEFNVYSEEWSIGEAKTTGRAGKNTLGLTAATSTTVLSELAVDSFSLTDYSVVDRFSLAVNADANTETVTVRIGKDSSNYYRASLNPAAGYNILEWAKGAMVTVGSPTWDDISYFAVSVTASAGGSTTADFDSLRVEDVDNLNPEYNLISREVLVTPTTKNAGVTMDIEYKVPITI